ncbi:YceI family protein [Aestuariimicrobium kwangyangense]|uniref:YceI family protein n=1 Tax=Aestuariimicrobium kwangyangense TaxID=396389 RepID=UPI0003B528C1|nr:YceI family protein [Aestuariimicrobium kwangyangense]
MNAPSGPDLTSVPSENSRWTVVPESSTATFSVRDKLVATTRGTLPITAGRVVTDADGSVVSSRVDLDLTRVDTGNAHRDRDLQKPSLLDGVGHPVISVHTGPTTPQVTQWTVPATLSARGASCPLELHVSGTTTDQDHAQVHVTARLDRTGLGMRVPTFIIGRLVDIDVAALFERTGTSTGG